MAKINERVLDVWVGILRQEENCRLLLLAPEGRRAHLRDFFGRRGIDPGRIGILAPYLPTEAAGQEPSDEYLRRYERIDIALDPFPYNGMTTTCDALWMGVPVVAVIGETTLGRASFSLLSNVGLSALAAKSEEDYVGIAVRLARDLPRLTALRASLRDRMKKFAAARRSTFRAESRGGLSIDVGEVVCGEMPKRHGAGEPPVMTVCWQIWKRAEVRAP